MIAEMANVAAECFRNPRKRSVWSAELGRYVCPDSDDGKAAIAKARDVVVSPETREKAASHSPINPTFKLVFVTAASGTFLFLALCVVVTLLAGKEPPPLMDKFVTTVLDLVKIGFGAIVGLLGGKVLQAEPTTSSRKRSA
jgi:hypothetical protein